MVASDLEALLWAAMGRFEELAMRRYEADQPWLATDARRDLVRRLRAAAAGADLDAHALGEPVRALVAAADGRGVRAAALVQGLVLESLARAIYGALARSEHASAGARALAADAHAASEEVALRLPAAIRACAGEGDALFAAFASETRGVLPLLDPVGEVVDRAFGDHFGIAFADLTGELVADVVLTLTDLGVDRRRIVVHLTEAMMGL